MVMSYENVIEIGPCPANEPCQKFPDYDTMQAREDCRQFIALIRKKLGNEPDGAHLFIQGTEHSQGRYYEVAVKYDNRNPKAAVYASAVEANAPVKWDTVTSPSVLNPTLAILDEFKHLPKSFTKDFMTEYAPIKTLSDAEPYLFPEPAPPAQGTLLARVSEFLDRSLTAPAVRYQFVYVHELNLSGVPLVNLFMVIASNRDEADKKLFLHVWLDREGAQGMLDTLGMKFVRTFFNEAGIKLAEDSERTVILP